MGKKRKRELKKGVIDSIIDISDRYPYQLLSIILLLALILRILALLSLKQSIYSDFLIWDERVYHNWAIKIANGISVTPAYDFAPLPAYIMAIIYKLFSPDTLYIRIMNIGFGVLTCFLIYLIGKEVGNRITGLVACLIASLYKPFIFFSVTLLKTSLSLFLFASAIYLVAALIDNHSMIKEVLLGILIGLMINVRPNCVVLIPLILLIILWDSRKWRPSMKMITTKFISYVVGLSIAIAPFAILNYRVSGEFGLIPIGGFNLYLANNLQNPYPYYRPVPFASSLPSEQAIHFIIEASKREGKKLSPREASLYWTHEVFRTALERPNAITLKIFQKIMAFFNQFEAADNYHIGFLSDYVRFLKFPFLSFLLILPFGMAGMAVSLTGSKKAFALGSIFFLYALTLIIFFTNIRIRLPTLIILIPFAVIGINRLLFYINNRRFKRIIVYLAVVAAFFIIEFLPLRGTGDMTAYYNTHAIILSSKGFESEAAAYWEKSSKMNRPYSAFANLSLAAMYLKGGEIKKTKYYIDKVSDESFAAASKYELMGDMMMHMGQKEKAVAAYEKSLEINSGRRGTRLKLIKILWRIDKQKALEEHDKLEYINSFYDIL